MELLLAIVVAVSVISVACSVVILIASMKTNKEVEKTSQIIAEIHAILDARGTK